MNIKWEADWDHERATKTYLKYRHKLLKRPKGVKKYSLVSVEEIYCGWGIRVRVWPDGRTYVLAHNVIEEEHWVDCTPKLSCL